MNLYKGYFNDAFKGVAETNNIRRKDAYKLIGTIGDDEVATAFADVLFRDNYIVTSEMVQRALNAALPSNQKIMEGGGPGTQTFKALRKISKNAEQKRIFLDKLGDLRDVRFKEAGDSARNEYFRFRD